MQNIEEICKSDLAPAPPKSCRRIDIVSAIPAVTQTFAEAARERLLISLPGAGFCVVEGLYQNTYSSRLTTSKADFLTLG